MMEKVFTFFTLSLLVFTFFYYQFWRYPVWRYYLNFYQFITAQKSKAAYFSFFDGRVNETYQLSRLIRSLTGPTDRIFVWGNEPYLYALSNRLPVGRYTVAYHVVDFDGWQETTGFLKQDPPVLIIKIKGNRQFRQLDEILKTDYLKLVELEKSVVFKKI